MIDDAALDLLLAIRLRGGVVPTSVDQLLDDVDPDAAAALLAAVRSADLVADGRYGRVQLTPEGRFVLDGTLARELDGVDGRERLRAALSAFEDHNVTLLAICTDWQLRVGPQGSEPNDHTDGDYDGTVIARLAALHRACASTLDEMVAVAPRLAVQRGRLAIALDRLQAGDHDYLTNPRVASYHSCWHELHEALFVHLGIDRADHTRPT